MRETKKLIKIITKKMSRRCHTFSQSLAKAHLIPRPKAFSKTRCHNLEELARKDRVNKWHRMVLRARPRDKNSTNKSEA
jgi:hypothetical protein